MIRAFHVVWGVYGFWLPNDPRGSWSDFVASWELAQHGKATKGKLQDVERERWEGWRNAATATLRYPAVHLTGIQGRAAGNGFGIAVQKSQLVVWACSILPQHVHLVLARQRLGIDQCVNLLKGEATKQLKREGNHPLAEYETNGKFPSLWGEGCWKVFLDTDQGIRNAIEYVEQNPVKEGKRRQKWSFITSF